MTGREHLGLRWPGNGTARGYSTWMHSEGSRRRLKGRRDRERPGGRRNTRIDYCTRLGVEIKVGQVPDRGSKLIGDVGKRIIVQSKLCGKHGLQPLKIHKRREFSFRHSV